jgi:iturin family lipopeptide synthetase C
MKEHTSWWQTPYNDKWTVSSLLAKQTPLHGDSPALINADATTTSHQQISLQAGHIRGLIAAKIEPGETVATLLSLGENYLAAIYAIFTSRNIYVTIDPEAPTARNHQVIESTSIKLILADARYYSKALQLKQSNPELIIINIEKNLPFADNSGDIHTTDPEDIAAYLTTSGSTGVPKTVIRTHKSYLHTVYVCSKVAKYNTNDLTLVMGSPAHVGLLNQVLDCLINGYCCIFVPINDFTIQGLVTLISHHPITNYDISPAILSQLLPELKKLKAFYPPRQFFVSGGALATTDRDKFNSIFDSKVDLLQNYGSTEAGPIMSARYKPECVHDSQLPLTTKAHGMSIEIIDSNNRPLSNNISGEILLRSAYLANGYLAAEDGISGFGHDEKGPYFKTGDIGLLNNQGELYLHGRADRQFNKHGRRYEFGELENAIKTNDNWDDAVAIYQTDADRTPLLIVAIQASQASDQNIENLRNHLAAKIPPALIPNQFIIVDKIPRTASGKISFPAAKAQINKLSLKLTTGLGGPPQGMVENYIADCWESIFSIPRPGRSDTFISVGGDSLLATQLILMLDQRFNLDLSLDQMSQAQTIELQAQMVSAGNNISSEALIPIRLTNTGPICIFIPGLGGHAWVFNNLSNLISIPSDIYSVSFKGLFEKLNSKRPSKIDANRIVCEAIHKLPKDRPLILVGYSLGTQIATEICQQLHSEGRHTTNLILLDPVMAFSTLRKRSRSALNRKVSKFKRLLIKKSKAQKVLEKEVNLHSHLLRRLYKSDTFKVLPNQTNSILQTEDGKMNFDMDIFAKAKNLRSDFIPCGHLDCVRYPHVKETAKWLSTEIAYYL